LLPSARERFLVDRIGGRRLRAVRGRGLPVPVTKEVAGLRRLLVPDCAEIGGWASRPRVRSSPRSPAYHPAQSWPASDLSVDPKSVGLIERAAIGQIQGAPGTAGTLHSQEWNSSRRKSIRPG
jgi:hypothetical protein